MHDCGAVVDGAAGGTTTATGTGTVALTVGAGLLVVVTGANVVVVALLVVTFDAVLAVEPHAASPTTTKRRLASRFTTVVPLKEGQNGPLQPNASGLATFVYDQSTPDL